MLQLITAFQAWYTTRVRDERGATAVEYGLMVALIAVVIIGAVTTLGGAERITALLPQAQRVRPFAVQEIGPSGQSSRLGLRPVRHLAAASPQSRRPSGRS